MNFFGGSAPHDFARALSVFDVHPEQGLDNNVEAAAGELPDFGLGLVENGALEPAGTDDAIGFAGAPDQVMKRARRACAIGIDVADQIGERGKFQTFDESAAFADGFGKIQKADEGEIGGNFLDDAAGVVFAAVENDDELKFAVVFLLEIATVLAEDRLDAVLLVVSRDQEQQAWFTHVMLNSRWMPNFSTRLRRVARVMPSSFAAWTWLPLASLRA